MSEYSLGEFAMHLATLKVKELVALHKGLKRVAEVIEKTAIDKIGEYQDAVGPFPAWAPLAESTEAQKAAMGYPEGAPLLRNGDLRGSITHEVHELEAVVGSTSDVAIYQEFGTSTIPPRPFIGPAVVENEKKILRLVGAAAVFGLTEGLQIEEALEYDRIIQS